VDDFSDDGGGKPKSNASILVDESSDDERCKPNAKVDLVFPKALFPQDGSDASSAVCNANVSYSCSKYKSDDTSLSDDSKYLSGLPPYLPRGDHYDSDADSVPPEFSRLIDRSFGGAPPTRDDAEAHADLGTFLHCFEHNLEIIPDYFFGDPPTSFILCKEAFALWQEKYHGIRLSMENKGVASLPLFLGSSPIETPHMAKPSHPIPTAKARSCKSSTSQKARKATKKATKKASRKKTFLGKKTSVHCPPFNLDCPENRHHKAMYESAGLPAQCTNSLNNALFACLGAAARERIDLGNKVNPGHYFTGVRLLKMTVKLLWVSEGS